RLNLFKDSSRRSDDVIVVLLDQHSLDWGKTERGWGWPWPRKAYADFVDYLNLGQASSVVFDVLFSEPSVHLSYRPLEKIDEAARGLVAAREAAQAGQAAQTYFDEVMGVLETLRAGEDDAAFAEAAERSGRVVQGVFFSTVTGALREWPAGLSTPLFRPQGFDEIIDLFSLEHDGNAGAQFPIESLRASAGALGSVTGTEDSDGTFRRMRLFTLFDGRAVPTLSAAALFAAGGMPAEITFDPRRRAIQWGGFTIPVDSDGKTLLRFRGALERYPQHSMSAILQSAADHAAGREPTFPPEDFKGAHVFVGFYAPGLFDIFATPVSPLYPGVGVHVTMMDNMLMGDFITRAPDWIALAMIAAAVVAMTLLVLYSGKAGRSAGGLAAALLAIVVAGLVAFNSGLWIPMATPLLAALLAFFSATFYSYATEGRDKRFIKNAFSRILSPKVIDQIIADPTQLKLGGERRKMTAMFTDIQRFSTISSVLQDKYGEDGPKVLVNLLNLYLTEMSDIVLGNGGTIDKYEGDAIIAFFGAPAWMENHAALACRSAVQMKKREKQLVEKIMNPDGEFHGPLSRLIDSNVVRRERPLYTRLGINTGDMVVGFMGTPAKMDYTIMGNAVNLTARLEGVNKQYDTQGILISEYTRDQLGQEFIVRPLSRVTVVGIPAPLRLYELLDIREEAPPELIKATENWEKAFAAYEGRNFAWAQKAFAELRRLNPEDSVAKFYAERCARYQAEPVSADWDGVDNLTEK
ncbi:MAG: adenylate/guanylate cyclase domain-containing protein, partial [Treponema sp.]|nr:adenylate/guanylate cyclase domain-containing protein [Treponema sp.]